jgi:hypothetical protein
VRRVFPAIKSRGNKENKRKTEKNVYFVFFFFWNVHILFYLYDFFYFFFLMTPRQSFYTKKNSYSFLYNKLFNNNNYWINYNLLSRWLNSSPKKKRTSKAFIVFLKICSFTFFNIFKFWIQSWCVCVLICFLCVKYLRFFILVLFTRKLNLQLKKRELPKQKQQKGVVVRLACLC